MCRHFTARTGIATLCLRPPAVFDEETYRRIRAAREADAAFEWTPFWAYGAFLDLRDLSEAVRCALACPDPGHVTLLLCADDVSSREKTSRDLARELCPDATWRGGAEYDRDPYRALLDTRRARRVLDWAPQHTWRPK